MPLYEFRCSDCHQDFEALVRGDDQPPCPQCESKRAERLFSTSVGRVGGLGPITASCPPPSTGPCGPGCCRLPG